MDLPPLSKTLKKALLIDDDEVDLYITERIIHSSNLTEEVVAKTNVDDAIDYLRESGNSRHGNIPDIIFLDMNMPGKNGYDFIDEFKKLDENIKSCCQIILLMNSPTTELNGQLSIRCGKSKIQILEKPLTVEVLRKMCSKLMNQNPGSGRFSEGKSANSLNFDLPD